MSDAADCAAGQQLTPRRLVQKTAPPAEETVQVVEDEEAAEAPEGEGKGVAEAPEKGSQGAESTDGQEDRRTEEEQVLQELFDGKGESTKSEAPSELPQDAQVVPSESAALPQCKRCMVATDPTRPGCKTSGKVGNLKVTCSSCNYKETRLRRIFGMWPIQEFDELKEEEQVDFYQKCGTAMADVRKHISETLVRVRMLRKERARGGKFLPLEVYEKMGYNIEDIQSKSNPDDIEHHPVLGTTYRVEIHTTSQALVEEDLRRQVASKLKSKGRRSVFGEVTDGAVAASSGIKRPAPAGDGSSSDSSSSSSSSDKRRRKSKKNKHKNKGHAAPPQPSALDPVDLPPGMTMREHRTMEKARRQAELRAERAKAKEEAKAKREQEKEQRLQNKKAQQEEKKALLEQKKADRATRSKIVSDCTKTIVGARPVIRATELLLAHPKLKKVQEKDLRKTRSDLAILVNCSKMAEETLDDAKLLQISFTLEMVQTCIKDLKKWGDGIQVMMATSEADN